MARLHRNTLTFAGCVRLTGKNRRGSVRLMNNTVLYKRNDDTYAICLYNTNVVLIHRSGSYTLDTGGYHSQTTKHRINSYSPARIHSKDFVLYVGDLKFHDGMVVDSHGKVIKPCEGCRAEVPEYETTCDKCQRSANRKTTQRPLRFRLEDFVFRYFVG